MKLLASGDFKSFFKELSKMSFAIRFELVHDVLAACKGSELIIGGTLMHNAAAIMSEKLEIPFMMANVNPINVETGAFPHFLTSQRILPFSFLNRLTYKLAFKSWNKQLIVQINEWRKDIGLAPAKTNVFLQFKKLKVPILHGYSHYLLERPIDWDSHIAVTGVWKLNTKHAPAEPQNEEFVNWLKEGRPPIYFGFGSMPILNPKEMFQMINEICDEMGLRAIINAGWSKFDEGNSGLNNSVYLIKNANFEWLFPRCSIVVHHGGVGTTHLGIEAGVPTIICSIFFDNPLWGEQIKRLKIGTHIRFKDLSKKRIIKAIKQLQNDKIKETSMQIGRKMIAENGLKTAIELIEKYFPLAPIYSNEI